MKKSNVFVAISVVFLSFMIIFYGSRLVYFYTIDHADQKLGESTLLSVLQTKSYDKEIVKEGKALYYAGNVLNNYVFYSNRYYRVISFGENIVLIDDVVSTILPYNDIEEWLRTTYRNSLIDSEQYITDITILSSVDYQKIDTGNNYIKGSFFWLKDNKYLNEKGNIFDSNDGLYGVKAVLKLKDDVLYYGGTGTYYDPYFIDMEDAHTFNETQAGIIRNGSYIKYSDKVWRVIDTGDAYKLVLNELLDERRFSKTTNIFDLKDSKGVAYYLNKTFIDELDTDLLVKGKFNIGSFNNSYKDTLDDTVEAYVGLMGIGDLFISDLDNYYTLTNTGIKNTVYKVTNGKLYADEYKSKNAIRPVVYMKKDVKIVNGFGTLESPFEVEK